MELTPEQKQFLDRALLVERLVRSDEWESVRIEAREFSRQWLNSSQIDAGQCAFYAGGAKAVLDFIDFLADIPRQKDALVADAARSEAAPKGPKPSPRVSRQEPTDL